VLDTGLVLDTGVVLDTGPLPSRLERPTRDGDDRFGESRQGFADVDPLFSMMRSGSKSGGGSEGDVLPGGCRGERVPVTLRLRRQALSASDARRLFVPAAALLFLACGGDRKDVANGAPDSSSDALSANATDGDATGGDATSKDASPADASSSDADSSPDVDSSPDAGSSSDAGSCQDGARQCRFNGVQTCMAGSWGDAVACPSSTPNCVAGVCAQPPSCQVSTLGTTNCGAGGSATESCCASPEVPGGTYYRTYDPLAADGGITLAADGGPAGEADPATVSDFRLDKYLVTVGRFRQYVNYLAGGGAPPTNGSGKHVHLNGGQGLVIVNAPGASEFQYEQGWYAGVPTPIDENVKLGLMNNGVNLTACGPVNSTDNTTWTLSPGANENLPVGCVTWYEAYGFCIWDGGFLPSEAEWGYAAAGGSQQREYPWGATAPGTENQYEIYCGDGQCYYESAQDGGPVAPVGTPSLGVGRWGQLDLAGEMKEWMLDFYNSGYADPCTDCGGYSQASDIPGVHVYRDWAGSPLSTYRGPGHLEHSDGGFRCARTP
jgi:formylglycine-generating enzyme